MTRTMRGALWAASLALLCLCVAAFPGAAWGQSHWYVAHVFPETWAMHEFVFADAQNGWGFGIIEESGDAIVVGTSDGGATWSTRAPATSHQIHVHRLVASPDPAVAWLQAWDKETSDTLMFKTTDAGATWVEWPITPSGAHVVGLFALSADTVWMATSGGVTGEELILSSGDGGATWSTKARNWDPGGMVGIRFCFVDALNGWAGGQLLNILLHTTDGGLTWEEQSLDETGDLQATYLESLDFVSPSLGWAVINSSDYEWGKLLRTQDGGRTWETQIAAPVSRLRRADFVDATHGWMTGDPPTPGGWDWEHWEHPDTILRTDDGGASWQADYDLADGVAGVSSVQFLDARTGWASAFLPELSPFDWPASVLLAYDATPPSTHVDAYDQWSNRDVELTFRAADSGSGVDYTESRVDDGRWQAGATCTVRAAADHSADGPHTVLYRSVDRLGNQEAPQSCRLVVDTVGPSTAACRRTKVRRGDVAELTFEVHDALSPAAAVTLDLLSARGAVLRSLSLGMQPVGERLTAALDGVLPRGSYRFRVHAVDLAGNHERLAAVGKLTVR